MHVGLRTGLLLLVVTVVAACKTSEERAEDHFQNAQALLTQGDFERASVEFRNVFELNGRHREARSTYAEALRERGNTQQAFAQYLRLIEQFNDDLPGRIALAEMSLVSGNRVEAERHIGQGLRVYPDNLELQALKSAYDYSEGQITRNDDLKQDGLRMARELQKEMPDNIVLRRVLVDDLVRNGRPSEALEAVDSAIELVPDDLGFYRQRLGLLTQMGENDAVTEQLIELVDIFPQDPSMRSTLLRWYISREDLDSAESFLRSLITKYPESDTPKLDVVQFLTRYRTLDLAVEEIDAMVVAAPDNLTLRATRAALKFERGDRSEAIDEMRSLIEAAQSGQRLNDIKVSLAQMLNETGDAVGARAIVEEVLEIDATHVGALKLRANWLIDQDQTDTAIIALRAALDQNPRDPELMTIMARAHERAGSLDLAAEMLSLAVDASNKAPEESVRYAQFLLSRDQLRPAENLLIDALRVSPQNPAVLFELGKVYVRTREWDRARGVVADLRGIPDDPASQQAANGLEVAIIGGEGGLEESIDFLNSMVNEGIGGVNAQAAIVRAHVQNGNLEAARQYIEEARQKSPDNPVLRFIEASVQGLRGETDLAERGYRELTESAPEFALSWRALYVKLSRENRVAEAEKVLEAAIEAVPQDRDIRWAWAGLLERRGDLQGALDVFEELYSEDSASPIVANNLASLLTTISDAPQDMQRAARIVRRLRSSNFPPFLDTYGWVSLKNGDVETAISYLERAATALPDDAAVQYHLGMAYLASERVSDAKSQFERAVSIGDAQGRRPQVELARAELAKLAE